MLPAHHSVGSDCHIKLGPEASAAHARIDDSRIDRWPPLIIFSFFWMCYRMNEREIGIQAGIRLIQWVATLALPRASPTLTLSSLSARKTTAGKGRPRWGRSLCLAPVGAAGTSSWIQLLIPWIGGAVFKLFAIMSIHGHTLKFSPAPGGSTPIRLYVELLKFSCVPVGNLKFGNWNLKSGQNFAQSENFALVNSHSINYCRRGILVTLFSLHYLDTIASRNLRRPASLMDC
eukprot:SAG31_NODE_189_length_20842_cov_12.518151_3_plen_232_part_00